MVRITERQLRRIIKEELVYLYEESSMDVPSGEGDDSEEEEEIVADEGGDEAAESKASLRLKLIDLAKTLPKASGIAKKEVEMLDRFITALLNTANSGNIATGQISTSLARSLDKLDQA